MPVTGVHLTSDDVQRLEVAQRVLLSPLACEDATEWQLRANRAVRQLVNADHSVFSVPGGATPALVSDDIDPAFSGSFLNYCIGLERDEYRFRDPLVDRLGRARRAAGTGVFHQLMFSDRKAIERSTAYQELFVPAGLTNLIGFSLPVEVGEATQFFSFEGADAELRSERGVEVLRLLIPVFEAAVRVHLQSRGRPPLISVFDRLGKAAAVYSPNGTPLHRTPALDDLLRAEPESAALRERMEELARVLTMHRSRRSKTADSPGPCAASEYIRTATAEYRLLGSYSELPPIGREAVLVLVERVPPLFPSTAHLRSGFGLTRREAEVALLLADGRTDGSIAHHLGLSPHTARRYSERVLRKLGLHSRAAVAVTLLRAGDQAPPQ
jgi:DNA-binding CsgD family transcriptional regulator